VLVAMMGQGLCNLFHQRTMPCLAAPWRNGGHIIFWRIDVAPISDGLASIHIYALDDGPRILPIDLGPHFEQLRMDPVNIGPIVRRR
jgi:hypothetical protein